MGCGGGVIRRGVFQVKSFYNSLSPLTWRFGEPVPCYGPEFFCLGGYLE